MSILDVWIESRRLDFIDQLDDLGLRQRAGHPDAHLTGAVTTPSGRQTVTVVLRDEFPYLPPLVFPTGVGSVRSWHLDSTGSLCLYTAADGDSQPWLDTRKFVERIEIWFEQEAAGWPDDPPSLDAERYVECNSQAGLTVLYDDLDSILDRYVKLTRVPDDYARARPAAAQRTSVLVHPSHERLVPPARHRSHGDRYAWVQDIGELDLPVRNWDDLRPHLTDSDAVERQVRATTIRFLLLRYHRKGHTGLLAVEAAVDESGTVRLGAVPAASAEVSEVRFRGGLAFPTLQTKRVAVVGVGAVGSFTADLLARDGVGHLTLYDNDDLLPGNLVRHLCGPAMIGVNKAKAVAATVISAQPRLHGERPSLTVDARTERVLRSDQAMSLLTEHHLVLDATADGVATSLLRDAARANGVHCISVCLVNDGAVARVDILPPLTGDPLPPSPPVHTDAGAAHFETGCDDPISPTPPDAVVQAASLAARHAVSVLLGTPLHAAGEIVELRPTA